MRYTSDQKQQTAANILAAAGRGFRLEGYGGAGVDGLAHEAGVTSGAFYKHFPSKAAAFEAAVGAGLKSFEKYLVQAIANPDKDWLIALVDYYFGKEHVANLADGCAVPGLTGEVIRGSEQVRVVYQQGIEGIVSTIASGLTHLAESERRPRAWAVLAMLSGGVQMARAVQDNAKADEIATAMRETVLRFAKAPRALSKSR
ncbi:MAG: TetR/AcrR family transcriptional regulator [Rhodoferax sp.]|uniref:TetR/AcrR family transcriptional regulator n=1 Tax=Rhodoferax sp. TaxID=50421 RepID=UPI00260E5CE5|nr:TetR/AcrR family transcriptional regulator [Rhodoferax sp.]MDD5332276.1 TetR/AcrR family transcriptional regulator [Rhodoferax sp.]